MSNKKENIKLLQYTHTDYEALKIIFSGIFNDMGKHK